MHDFWISVLTSSAVTGGVIKFVEWLINHFSTSKRKRREQAQEQYEKLQEEMDAVCDSLDALKADNLVIMHDRIYAFYQRHNKDNFLTVADRANLDYLFERYKAQGGNHKAELMYQVLCEKEVRGNEDED